MNSLLHKQLARIRKNCSYDNLIIERLQEIVSNTYDDFEKERKRKDHASKLMSDELLELNINIRKENREFVASVLSSIVEGAIITDKDGIILEMNQSAVEILGSLNNGLQNSPFSELLNKETNFNDFLNYYNETVFNQTTNYVEEYLTDINKKEIASELSISEYNSETEHYYIILIRDISKRKEFEDNIIRSKEEAEKASISKSDFLSTMSHEIRTPLNSIIGISNIMSMEKDVDELRKKYLDVLKTSSANLLSLINDILDFNKIESGKIEFNNSEFNLYELIQGIVEVNSFKASEKGLGIELNYDKRVPELVVGDSARLSQVLINLTGNAIKFTKKGGLQIRVSLEKENKNQWVIKIAVKDSGIGIDPAEHSQIFERFIQSGNSDSKQFGGTGLGLAISKKLIELQNGSINVESELGRGSEFIIQLEFDKPNKSKGVSTPLEIDLEPQKIEIGNTLLVEDNKSNQYVITQFFKKWGWKFDLAPDGLIACQMAEKKQYDLILMDLNMPVMDGYQATSKLRSLPKYAKTPIVALTASAMIDVQIKAKEAGVTDFMAKPFDPSQLRGTIIKYANKKQKK